LKSREAQATFASWIGIITNALLAALKAVVGLIANSQALIADAVHSASDVVSSFAVLAGIKASSKPPDKEHPYGHGKAESIATIIVSILLLVVGFEIGLNAFMSFFGPPPEVPGQLALYVVIFSILVKEGLYQYKSRLGIKLNSPALIADAWHHRSDVLSSVGVFVGIGGALIGSYYNISFLLYFDPLAGLVVSLIIFRIGYKMIKDSIKVILETVLEDEDVRQYEKTIMAVDGVREINTLHARTHGHYLILDLKVSVDAHITVEEGHLISKKVKKKLMDEYDEIQGVLIHVNPY